jgi:hypothetical protein
VTVAPKYDGLRNRVPIAGGVPDDVRIGKPMVDVICPGCDARYGRAAETEDGPLLWLWHSDGEHLPRMGSERGPELVHLVWRFVDGGVCGPVKPGEQFGARCRDCGSLEVKGSEVLAGIHAYRRMGKLQRVLARKTRSAG